MNFFEKLFKKPKKVETQIITNIGTQTLGQFGGLAYESDIFRSGVDAIARNTAKLFPTHIIKTGDQQQEGNQNLNRMLQIRPNKYMSTFDLLYKMVTQYFVRNNAFAYIERDRGGNPISIYPLTSTSMQFMEDAKGDLFCKFIFLGGKVYTFPYTDIIHLRRHYNQNELLGDSNTAIMNTLQLAHAQNEGLLNAIETGAKLKGILQMEGIANRDDIKKSAEDFKKDYMNLANTGGIAGIDGKSTFTQIKDNESPIDHEQMELIKKKIYDYLGISEKVVNSSYLEDEYSSFVESVIEPIGVQLSLEFTTKLFTNTEQKFGNRVIFQANRLMGSSAKSKSELIEKAVGYGVMNINEARIMLGLPQIEGGERFVQTLNLVNQKIVDQYQLKGKGGAENEGD